MSVAASSGGPAGSAPQVAPHNYYRHINQHRFTTELEFLSSLSSPAYIAHLYGQGHLSDPAFIRYLAYLYATWSQPRYVRFVRYPNALLFCKALARSPAFRAVVGTEGWEHTVTNEILAIWSQRGVENSDDDKDDEGADDEEVAGGSVRDEGNSSESKEQQREEDKEDKHATSTSGADRSGIERALRNETGLIPLIKEEESNANG